MIHKQNYVYIPFQKEPAIVDTTVHSSAVQLINISSNASTGANGMLLALAAKANISMVNDSINIVQPGLETVDEEEMFSSGSRRIGIHISNSRLPNPTSLFRPQAYREDNPLFAETSLPNSDANEPFRLHRPIVFERDTNQNTYPYDLLGLGNVNKAPPYHTSPQYREGGDHSSSTLQTFQRSQRGTIKTAYIGEHNLPPQISFNEYRSGSNPDIAGSRKSRYYHFKSARSPRVVFPANDDTDTEIAPSGTGATGIEEYFNDNVVFRDQNFGINDLAVIQDVRNEFSLQDLDSSSDSNVPQTTAYQSATTFKEKGTLFNN